MQLWAHDCSGIRALAECGPLALCAQDFRLTAREPTLSVDLSQRLMLVFTYECVRQWVNLVAGVMTGVQQGGRRGSGQGPCGAVVCRCVLFAASCFLMVLT